MSLILRRSNCTYEFYELKPFKFINSLIDLQYYSVRGHESKLYEALGGIVDLCNGKVGQLPLARLKIIWIVSCK